MFTRRIFYGWVILAAAFMTHFIVAGAGFTFGVFILPMSRELGWSVSSIALGISIRSWLFGFAQPFTGALVSRFGPKKVIGVGMLIMGMNTFFLSTISSKWQFYLMFGVVATLAAATGGSTAGNALIARWFQKRRTLAMAIASAGSSAGQMVIVPLVTFFMLPHGWRFSYMVLGSMVLLLAAPLAFLVFKNDPAELNLLPDGERLPPEKGSLSVKTRAVGVASRGQTTAMAQIGRTSLLQAMATRTFWLLAIGFFVCGFTSVGLQSVYLVPHAVHQVGLSEATAGMALGLMGGTGVLGTLTVGFLGDRLGKKKPLASLYFIRGLSFILAMLATSEWHIFVAAALMGFSFIATVPLVASLVADTYGSLSVATIYGTIFAIHQGGAAIGAIFGGQVMDAFGSLYWAWFGGALLLFVAGTVSYLIRERKPLA